MAKLEWTKLDDILHKTHHAEDAQGRTWQVIFCGFSDGKNARLNESGVVVYCNDERVAVIPVERNSERAYALHFDMKAPTAREVEKALIAEAMEEGRAVAESRAEEQADGTRRVEHVSFLDKKTGLKVFSGCTHDGYVFHGNAADCPQECGIVTPDHPDGSAVVKFTVCNPQGFVVYDFDHAGYCVPDGDDDMDAVNEILLSLDLQFGKGE